MPSGPPAPTGVSSRPAPSRGQRGRSTSRSVTPTGSNPASRTFSSATALSTPPDMATATRRGSRSVTGAAYRPGDAAAQGIDGDQEALTIGVRATEPGLHVGHADGRGLKRRSALDQGAQECGGSGRVGAAEAAVPGGGDAAISELELDPHVIAAGCVTGLTHSGLAIDRTGPLKVQRMVNDSVGIHPAHGR